MREAVTPPGTVTELFVTREAAERHPELLGPAAEQGVPVQLVSGEVMSAIAQTVTPQGSSPCAGPGPPPRRGPGGGPRPGRGPGPRPRPGQRRHGAAHRRRGADAVLLTGDSVDPYNPKCVRASAGSPSTCPWWWAAVAADLPARAGRVAGPGRRRARRPRPGPGRRPGAARRADRLGVRQRGPGLPAETRALADLVVRARSTGGPRASTWRPPPRSASTHRPGPARRGRGGP